MPTRDRDGPDVETLFLLRAARRTGLLEALLSEAGTPEDAAAKTDVSPRAAGVAVRALADAGFLARVGEEYEPTNRALGFLATRDLRSVGRLPHELDEFDRLAALDEALRGDPPTTDRDADRNALGAHAATPTATVRARVTAALRATDDPADVLDVGGASGVHAEEFAARGLAATLLEGAATVSAVEPRLAGGDVSLVAGSVVDLPPSSFDLVFLGGVSRRLSPAENRALVASAAERLRPGGTLAVVDAVRGVVPDERAAGVDVRRLAAGSGGAHDLATYRDWFDAAGLAAPDAGRIPGTDDALVAGDKREVD